MKTEKFKIIDLDFEEYKKVMDHLKSGKAVYIKGLGTLSVQCVKGRKAVHNFSNKTITFKPFKRIVFAANEIVKEAINSKKPLKSILK